MEATVQTIIQHPVTLAFANEAEARDFLVDPVPAQDAVRAQLASVHGNGVNGEHDDVGMPKKTRKISAEMGGAKREKRPLERSASPARSGWATSACRPIMRCRQPEQSSGCVTSTPIQAAA